MGKRIIRFLGIHWPRGYFRATQQVMTRRMPWRVIATTAHKLREPQPPMNRLQGSRRTTGRSGRVSSAARIATYHALPTQKVQRIAGEAPVAFPNAAKEQCKRTTYVA